MTVDFSIIVPTYNHADFLKNAVDSVVNQTYRNWELIIVDNFSDDNTFEIVNSYKDKRISYCKFKNNGVIAASRNHGIKISSGNWIAFLDSDDIWYSNKLSVIIEKILNNTDCQVFCSHEYKVFQETNKKQILKVGPYNNQFYKYMIIHGNKLSTSSTIISKKIIDRGLIFDESKDLITVEDYDLWLRIAESNFKFFFINIPLGEYLVHKNNLSQNILKHLKRTEFLLKIHVFNRQSFTSNKYLLWSFVKARISMSKLQQLIIQKNYSKALIVFVLLFLNNPLAIIYFSFLYIKNNNA